jgi:hypothetical protein
VLPEAVDGDAMSWLSRLWTALRRAFGGSAGELRTFTVVGLVNLDAHGGRAPELVVAGIVEGDVVAIDGELSAAGRVHRFCHQVRARSAEAAEAESRAYFTYLQSVMAVP